jgi:hypothetical protein
MDIKKSAKAGQLVHFTPISCVEITINIISAERLQGYGEGSGPDTPLCPKVLSNAHSITSC